MALWPGRRRSRSFWMSSVESGRLGGTPSITTPTPGPWLSPNVVMVKILPKVLPGIRCSLRARDEVGLDGVHPLRGVQQADGHSVLLARRVEKPDHDAVPFSPAAGRDSDTPIQEMEGPGMNTSRRPIHEWKYSPLESSMRIPEAGVARPSPSATPSKPPTRAPAASSSESWPSSVRTWRRIRWRAATNAAANAAAAMARPSPIHSSTLQKYPMSP